MDQRKGQLPAFGKTSIGSETKNEMNIGSASENTSITGPRIANTDNVTNLREAVTDFITKASQMGMNTQDILATIKTKQPTGVSFGKSITKPMHEKPKLILSNKLSFSDYKGSGQEFKLAKGTNITDTERILIDNIFIAHKKGNMKHIIASLNGLALYLTNNKAGSPCDIAFHGKHKGICKKISRSSPIRKKTGGTLIEALHEADTYLPKPYYKSPEVIVDLKQKGPESAQRLDEITDMRRTIRELEAQKLELKQQNELLREKIEHLQKPEATSYAVAITGEPTTIEDKIYQKVATVEENTEQIFYILKRIIKDQYNIDVLDGASVDNISLGNFIDQIFKEDNEAQDKMSIQEEEAQHI
ncbi:hypothetical protein J1N35_024611 [Gossypium stocksii]|uniref:Uncharacterized protein n=1 Tax=Gossypium stocksii TaxID=47602 RepID=A0A9D3V7R0_9ROSI|nr:hypothetical protein J1N35_024611 [Gossypium stocksii]